METGFSCRDVSLQSAHSAAEPVRAGLGTGTHLPHTPLAAGGKVACGGAVRASTPGNRGTRRPTQAPRGAPKPIRLR